MCHKLFEKVYKESRHSGVYLSNTSIWEMEAGRSGFKVILSFLSVSLWEAWGEEWERRRRRKEGRVGGWDGRGGKGEVGRMGREDKHQDRCIKRKKIERWPSENAKSIIIPYDGYHRAWISQIEWASSRTHNSRPWLDLGVSGVVGQGQAGKHTQIPSLSWNRG